MLSYFELRRGVKFILDGEPYEVLEFEPMYKAQDVSVAKTKIRNLITGKFLEKNFHLGDRFEEAELEKVEVKFLYNHRGKFGFCETNNPSQRFELEEGRIGFAAKFLKSNQIVSGLRFQDKIVTIVLPIKVQLKVTEAPPGVKGERAQAGTKIITLESGAQISTPLFIEENDIVEVNTETGEYVRKIE